MQFDLQSIEENIRRYGSPLYVFDEEAFLENYRRFERTFQGIYGSYRISYSYKTNYAPYICRLIRQEGGYAEVVSDMELAIARKCGNPDDHIVYNGPCKGEALESFILNGGMANVDNFEELERILAFAGAHPDRTYRFGLRVNIDIGQGFISRFGIDEADLPAAFAKVAETENAQVIGLHCHIGRSRTEQAWRNRAEIMLELVKRYFPEGPEYLSLGSGMFGEMDGRLAEQFGKDLPDYEAYARAVAEPVAAQYAGEKKPVLFTEPGTTLINKYISFITTVVSVKHIKGKTFITVDGSKHNIGEICELKQLPVQTVHASGAAKAVENADIVGYTCLEHDVLYRGYTGQIAAGDYLVFGNVGGYSNVSKPPFIKPNCCMVSSTGAVIKRAESVEEVICTYE